MDKHQSLAVVIPALNEELTIPRVLTKLPETLCGCTVVVYVVNDGSTDRTAEVAASHGAKVISHSMNRGVGASLVSGVAAAISDGCDYLVNIDADGQFDPSEIPKILEPILRGEADLVVGSRFGKERARPEEMSKVKFWGNKRMNNLVNALTGARFSDVSSGFRAYSRKALFNLNINSHFTYTQESIIDLHHKGLRVVNVPVEVKYFKERKSRVVSSVLSYGTKTFKIIIRAYRDFSPLRFFFYLGSLFFVAGLILDFFILVHFIRSGQFYPYKFLAFGGVYLNTLGILLYFIGGLADMLTRLRMNQEKLLVLVKEMKAELDSQRRNGKG